MPKPLGPGQGPGPPSQVSMRGKGKHKRRAHPPRSRDPSRGGGEGAWPGSGARTRRRAPAAPRSEWSSCALSTTPGAPTGSPANPDCAHPAAGSWLREGGIQALLAGDWEAGQRARGVWGVRRRWVGRPSWLTRVEQKVLRAAELPSQGAGPLKRAVGSSAHLALCLSFLEKSSVPPRGPGFVLEEKGTRLCGSGASSSSWVPEMGRGCRRAWHGPRLVPGPAELQNLAPSSGTN